ncbi:MAG: RNA polymerase sigma factor [Phycisphaeraceae bacterium]|nr:MAG: RNA polymerase sigma factor [Phycisphaeraceae bacterium]
MSRPDPDILRRAQAGDRDALDVLLRPELDRVFATCRRMVGGRQEAEELAQDALVKVIRGLPTYDGRASLSTWMTRVTINACLSWMRSRARHSGRRPISLEQPDTLAGEPGVAPGVQPDEKARLERALDGLKPEHRAILVLRDVRELDYEAIGAALDLPIGTVKSRLFRARAALRVALEEDERAGKPERVEDA